MEERKVRIGGIYRHFKGELYQVITVAKHSETGEPMVVYQALYGTFGYYVRPYKMFLSETDYEKYPEAGQKYRFELINRKELGNTVNTVNAVNPVEQEYPSVSKESEKEQVKESGTELKGDDTEEIFIREPEDEPEEPDDEPEEPEEEESPVDEEYRRADPRLLEFLEAETYAEKIQIFTGYAGNMDDQLLDSIAVSLDVALEEGNFQEKYQAVFNCLKTMEHFESERFRKK